MDNLNSFSLYAKIELIFCSIIFSHEDRGEKMMAMEWGHIWLIVVVCGTFALAIVAKFLEEKN